MSSILDALEKLERREASLRESAAPAHPPARRGWTAAAVLVAFVAGGGIAFSLRTGARLPEPTLTAAKLGNAALARAPETPAAAPAPAPPPAAAASPTPPPPQAVAEPVPVPPPAPAVAQPAPRIASAAPTPSVAPPAPAPPAAAPTPAVAAAPARTIAAAPPTPVAPPTPRVAARSPRDAAPAPVLSRAPAGTPRVRVSFLVYSPAPERRRVALTVDEGSMVTLHEGESAHDVEVERIFADRVQLRAGGQTFTLQARD